MSIFFSVLNEDKNERPHKVMAPQGKSGKVRIIKPADPEKLAKLRRDQKRVGDRREAVGMTRESESDLRRRGIYL